jgi:hypothetical protein
MRQIALLVAGMTLVVTAGAVAQEARYEARYELFPEPIVNRMATHWVSSAYVLDKTDNRFWICTVRYNFDSQEANNGDCAGLRAEIGRPSLNTRYRTRAVVGAVPPGAHLPVFWFIEPGSGDIQFCAPRQPGVCVRLALPQS